ncbi:MAG: GDSL-type esterase/lipase family protein [bacterium]|nr:GDSL-type esterase/lipase family protein [bacterium]
MKISIRKRTFVCIVIAAMLFLEDFATVNVYAASAGMSAGISAPLSEEPSDAALAQLTDEELRAYYGDSVFIGDSIMVGFRNYSAKQETYVHDIQFLAVGCYGVNNALKPVKGDNVHPKYQGKKCQLWDAIPLIGSKRAFIMFGMNDIAILGLEGARDKYKELIDKILKTSPELEIHIISMTYTLKGKGKKVLNNTNIDKYNTLLQEMAEENGWAYIDLCTVISDGEGNLAEDCCSDGFVHLTKTAYTLWETELINYANAVRLAEPAETEGTEIIAE